MDDGLRAFIGMSLQVQELHRVIEKASQHLYPVLILGESGTGKELVARTVHYLGPRGQMPFVPVDCASLTPTLVESELFGHIKGAFTGAAQTRKGLFEAANQGTLFLDEIGDLPVDMQAKLLRATQEKEIRPVGSSRRYPISVRLIAATNLDLDVAMRSGAFRQDLYFRLNVMQIKLPPLRERRNDIPLLASHFLEKFCDFGQPLHTISKDAMRLLVAYDWPGNVRELENAIQCAVALSSAVILQVEDLPSKLQCVSSQYVRGNNEPVTLEGIERRAICQALDKTNGDRHAAAFLLGIGKTTLYRKLKEYARDSAA